MVMFITISFNHHWFSYWFPTSDLFLLPSWGPPEVSGPPGIGKTTTCRLVAQIHGGYEAAGIGLSAVTSPNYMEHHGTMDIYELWITMWTKYWWTPVGIWTSNLWTIRELNIHEHPVGCANMIRTFAFDAKSLHFSGDFGVSLFGRNVRETLPNLGFQWPTALKKNGSPGEDCMFQKYTDGQDAK